MNYKEEHERVKKKQRSKLFQFYKEKKRQVKSGKVTLPIGDCHPSFYKVSTKTAPKKVK